MNRRRKHGPDWLPSRCYAGKFSYEYHPKTGGSVTLAKLDSPRSVVMAKYQEAVELENEPTGAFAGLMREYFKGANYKRLGLRTKQDYVGYSKRVGKAFGTINRHRIRPHHIRQYMDKRGIATEVQANREHSFMSAVFHWAYENGKVKMNPCLKVTKFPEENRDRYIENYEYDAVLKEAEANPLLWAAMEVSYCCAARQGDVWNLTREQLLKDGILIRQGKTKVKQLKEWNPRLRKAIDKALAQSEVPSFTYVFTKDRNFRPAQRTMAKWFLDARRTAEAKLLAQGKTVNFDFTFHDIKAKAISDYEGDDKKVFSGHKTDSQVAVYDRKMKLSPTLK